MDFFFYILKQWQHLLKKKKKKKYISQYLSQNISTLKLVASEL